MNSKLLADLSRLFVKEAECLASNKRGDGGEAMRLWSISVDLECRARDKRREEIEAAYMGGIE